MNNIVQFNDHNIQIIERTNQLWLSSGDIALALGYEKTKSITNLYNNHKEEFDGMSEVIDSVTSNSMSRRQRIFNREGAWLIGMFARTPKAAEFRKWVLKVLGAVADGQSDKPVIVSEHTRALPSGKKEIVLSAKAREEIREEIDHSVNNALERLFNPNPIENRNLFRFCSILQSVLSDSLDDILCTADKKDLENRRLKRALQKANSQLKQINASAQPIVIE